MDLQLGNKRWLMFSQLRIGTVILRVKRTDTVNSVYIMMIYSVLININFSH
jgi:hypothetical protein